MQASMEAGPDLATVVGDVRPADGSRTGVERRFRVSDTDRNAALKSMGEEGNAMRSAMLSCAFASAILSHTAFLSQNAVAEPNEVGQTHLVQAQTAPVHAQPRLRLAQNIGPAGKTGTVIGDEQKLSAGAEADGQGQVSALAAAAKAEKGKEAPIPAVDEETLALYPTAANVANAISKSTTNGVRRSMPMRRSRRCSTRSSRSSRS